MIRIQAALSAEPASGENAFVNVFHIGHDVGYEPTVAEMDVLLGKVFDFYNSPVGALSTVGSFYSSLVDEGAGSLTVKGYWKEGVEFPEPFGAPKSTIVGAMPAQVGSTNLPANVAAVLTLDSVGALQAPVELAGPPVTRPMKRRRGRLYLGPLNTGAATTTVGFDAVPSTPFRDAVFAAANRLKDDIDAVVTGDPYWGVYSRADGELRHLEAVSMDDRFDHVESRKRRTGTRARTLV